MTITTPETIVNQTAAQTSGPLAEQLPSQATSIVVTETTGLDPANTMPDTLAAIENDAPAIINMLKGYFFNRNNGDHEATQESVQDTLIRAWQARTQFDADRPEANLKGFMVQMAARQRVDSYRRRNTVRNHDNQLVARLGEQLLTVTGTTDTAANVIEREASQSLLALVTTLSTDQQTVIGYMLEGYTQAETAAALRIPIGTVKTRSSRAYKKLRALLGESTNPPTSVPEPPVQANQRTPRPYGPQPRAVVAFQRARIRASRRRAVAQNAPVAGDS